MENVINIEHSFWKPENCENCGDRYVYKMTRKGIGYSPTGDKKELLESAKTDLKQKFKDEFDLVACPSCHVYQDKMVEELRWNKLKTTHAYSIAGIMLSLLITAYIFVLKMIELNIDAEPFISSLSTKEIFHMLTAALIFFVVVLGFVVLRRTVFDPNKGKKVQKDSQALKADGSVYSNKDFKAKITKEGGRSGGMLAGAAIGAVGAYGLSQLGGSKEALDNCEMPVDEEEIAESDMSEVESIESIDNLELDDAIDKAFAEAGFDEMDIADLTADLDTDVSDLLDE